MEQENKVFYGMNDNGEIFGGKSLGKRSDIVAIATHPDVFGSEITLVDLDGQKTNPGVFPSANFDSCAPREMISLVALDLRVVRDAMFVACGPIRHLNIPEEAFGVLSRSGYKETDKMVSFMAESDTGATDGVGQVWLDPGCTLDVDDVCNLIRQRVE